MILTIDIGNTNIVLGIFREQELVKRWRVATEENKTADEYRVILTNLFEMDGVELSLIKGGIISSVVPPLTHVFTELVKGYIEKRPLIVGPGLKTGISILYDNPREVGADRIANAVGAYQKFRSACIVVDFGTATTFDYISEKAEYVGGLIVPGVEISAEALFAHTAKLPKVEIADPSAVVGRNTLESIQSGLINGYKALVEGIVQRIKEEQNSRARVIATGGLAPLITRDLQCIDVIDENLTLWGLYFIYQMNRR